MNVIVIALGGGFRRGRSASGRGGTLNSFTLGPEAGASCEPSWCSRSFFLPVSWTCCSHSWGVETSGSKLWCVGWTFPCSRWLWLPFPVALAVLRSAAGRGGTKGSPMLGFEAIGSCKPFRNSRGPMLSELRSWYDDFWWPRGDGIAAWPMIGDSACACSSNPSSPIISAASSPVKSIWVTGFAARALRVTRPYRTIRLGFWVVAGKYSFDMRDSAIACTSGPTPGLGSSDEAVRSSVDGSNCSSDPFTLASARDSASCSRVRRTCYAASYAISLSSVLWFRLSLSASIDLGVSYKSVSADIPLVNRSCISAGTTDSVYSIEAFSPLRGESWEHCEAVSSFTFVCRSAVSCPPGSSVMPGHIE